MKKIFLHLFIIITVLLTGITCPYAEDIVLQGTITQNQYSDSNITTLDPCTIPVSADVTFSAAGEIRLTTGFHAEAGSELRAAAGITDTDSDGLDDLWESEYGLDTSIDDSAYDLDNDGLSNAIEYHLNTDPSVANIVVADDSSGSHITIQSAIDAAVNSDTIYVLDGEYKGVGNRDIVFNGLQVTLRSVNGPEGCIINGEESGRGFEFLTGDDGVIVSGFTITNGRADYQGGGIYCGDSNPVIQNCIIKNNEVRPPIELGDSYGGGIYCTNASPIIANCVIADNSMYGGFVYLRVKGAGIYSDSTSSPEIVNSTIVNNTFSNTVNINTGGIFCASSSVSIKNCIIWNNDHHEINGSPTATYSCIDGGYAGGTDIITDDPMFTDLDNGNYSLIDSSPCVDSGTSDESDGISVPDSDVVSNSRPQNLGIDMGAYEVALGDSDADGLPDYWEIQYGLDWQSSEGDNGASGDPDGDSYTNLQEYLGEGGADGDPTGLSVAVVYPHESIQAAVDAASDGDTIYVTNGTFTGTGNKGITFSNFTGTTLTVRSVYGPDNCIIDCEESGRGFELVSGDDGITISGFTIKKGDAAGNGGGISCSDSSPTIDNCYITENNSGTALGGGGGISCVNADSIIKNCKIMNNTTTVPIGTGYAAGIYCENASPSIINCVIADNILISGYAYINGHGAGIYSDSTSSPEIVNSVIANNTFSGTINNDTGGIYCESTTVSIKNCIIWGNDLDQIHGSPTVSYSCIDVGYAGGTNIITDDPMFKNPDNGNYMLIDSSPCIDNGTADESDGISVPASDIKGISRPQDLGIDIGAYEVALRDSDNDGMPDYWEIQYGLDWLSSEGDNGANGDPDSDTYTNLEEYLGEGGADGDPTGLSVEVVYPNESIQAAIDAASDEDIIYVADGTFTGAGNRNIQFDNFTGTTLTVRSIYGPEDCIIDCEGADRGFQFLAGDDNITISGFTIKNAYYAEAGGGIKCSDSAPLIDNCHIISNEVATGLGGGAGIYCKDSAPTIQNCFIQNNTVLNSEIGYIYGAGIYCENASPVIINCVVSDNTLDGGTLYLYAYGAGIYLDSTSSAEIINSTIVNNTFSTTVNVDTGGVYCDSPDVIIKNSIIWNNDEDAIYGTPAMTFTCIEGGYTGEGNISDDPLFIDQENGDYRLTQTGVISPCIDAVRVINGIPDTDIEGVPRPQGARAEMGVYEVIMPDTDNDGMPDYWEIKSDLNPGDPSDADLDPDSDNLVNLAEYMSGSYGNDPDSDDDLIPDDYEAIHNINPVYDDSQNDYDDDGLTNLAEYQNNLAARNIDTDNDGLQDGTEMGYTLNDIAHDTDTTIFQPDVDPATTTDPLDDDSDDDNLLDSEEDANHDGNQDDGEWGAGGETDPNDWDSDDDLLQDDLDVAGCTNPLDEDSDDDGMLDGDEDHNPRNGMKEPNEPDPCNHDTDGDGMTDGYEDSNGLNYLIDDAYNDFDSDGFENYSEFKYGSAANSGASVPEVSVFYEYDELGNIKRITRIK